MDREAGGKLLRHALTRAIRWPTHKWPSYHEPWDQLEPAAREAYAIAFERVRDALIPQPLDHPFNHEDLAEMQQRDGHVKAVVAVSFSDGIGEDLDWLNDQVSKLITNDETALQDIDYKLVGAASDGDMMLIEITGVYAPDPE